MKDKETNCKILQLIHWCRSIWRMMSHDTKEAYFNTTGAIGFVEDVANIFKFDLTILSQEDMDKIIEYLV